MAVVGEIGEQIWLVDHPGGGWSTGATYSTDHIIDPPATLTGHCFLSRVQGRTSGPPGAAIGVSYVRTASGAETFFGGSDTWWPIMYNAEKIARFTVSMEAFHGDMTYSWFAQYWD